MRIAYLLDDTPLCGGVKVVFEHAVLLSKRGFSVAVITRGERPDWLDTEGVEFRRIRNDSAGMREALHPFDVVIATSYRQVLELHTSSVPLVHFSQGYEADHPFWQLETPDIEKAYSLPVPKITISKRVEALITEKFSRVPVYIPQGIDIGLFDVKNRSEKIHRIILVGIWENEIKGIREAVQGFALAKEKIGALSLVRVSTLPLSEDERKLYAPEEYHMSVYPRHMPRLYGECDLAIVPSHEGEGFGLPAIEAMACGLPVILTNIHTFRTLGSKTDYAYFVAPGSASEIAEGIIYLSGNPRFAEALGRRGREIAETFSIERTIECLITALTLFSKTYRREEKGNYRDLMKNE